MLTSSDAYSTGRMGESNFAARIGATLRKLRLSYGWTMAEVADQLGRDKQTIHRWEVGRCEMSLGTLYKIARLYRVSVTFIIESAAHDPDSSLPPKSKNFAA